MKEIIVSSGHLQEAIKVFENWGYSCAEEDLVVTRDTIQNFIDSTGQPSDQDKKTYLWEKVQQFKGQRRFDLLVYDCGDFRICVKM